jgi:putative membrane protein (TIGR04086 family)
VSRIEWPAVRVGALVSIVICLPVALLAQAIVDEGDTEQPPIVYVLYVAVLIGFVIGGWFAAKRATESPYSAGAVAALAGFVAIQTVGVIARLIDGDPIRVVLIVTNGLLAYGCGLLGAAIVVRQRP